MLRFLVVHEESRPAIVWLMPVVKRPHEPHFWSEADLNVQDYDYTNFSEEF